MWPFSRKPEPQPAGEDALQKPVLKCPSCNEKATFHLTWAEARHCVSEKHLCENHARDILTAYKPRAWGSSRPSSKLGDASEYDFDLIVISEIHDQQALYLRELGGDHFFPILTGIFEACALDRHLKHFQSPRPLTHDAAASILTALGGQLEHVLVDRFVENYWCAQLCLLQNGRRLDIDIRPSDAFMFALLLERPIYFPNGLVDKMIAVGK